MKSRKIDFLLLRIVLLLCVVAASEGVLAATSTCAYTQSGTGMGGTGIKADDAAPLMQPAGNVIFSRGVVEAQSQGRSRLLTKGAQVCVGETVATSDSGMVQIRMLDTGMVSVRPDTKMRIDAFQFNGKEDGSEKSAIYLIQGAFRAVTGLIGHLNKENYKILTPTATIGIRGTDHEPMFIPNPAPGQVAPGEPGTYDKVNSGGVFIQTAAGSVEVKPNQVGFVPIVTNVPPVILKETPRFYHAEAGAEARPHSSEASGGNGVSAREVSNNSPKAEHTLNPEAHAPALHVPDIHSYDSQSQDIHIPENQTHEGRAPAVQAPVVQTPTPVVTVPVQSPAIEIQER